MKELLEEYIGHKLKRFTYRERAFGRSVPEYLCVLEDSSNVSVTEPEIYAFLYKLASDKFSKTLEKLDDDSPKQLLFDESDMKGAFILGLESSETVRLFGRDQVIDDYMKYLKEIRS